MPPPTGSRDARRGSVAKQESLYRIAYKVRSVKATLLASKLPWEMETNSF